MAITEVLEKDTDIEIGADWECPICAQNPQFNDETIAAIEECQAMHEGKIPSKSYHSLEAFFQALHNQDA